MNEENKIKEESKTNVIVSSNESPLLTGTNDLNESLISIISKSICRIIIDTKAETGPVNKYGTGFLLNFRIEQEKFYCLITSEHIINKDSIINNNIICIYYDKENKKSYLKLDEKERYIKNFSNNDSGITVVEILDKDKISEDYFLFPELISINNDLINNQIFIPTYTKGKGLSKSISKITKINENEFEYLDRTKKYPVGMPIFLENSMDVLGIYKQHNEDKGENYGDFIYPLIDAIKNDIRKKRNKGKYENGKYLWEDGKYYIGDLKNKMPNGKGIKYYYNGNILYEGDFIDGKFDGNGKYIYEDGDYFIGQYKNGLRSGNGKIYYKNGNIMSEGFYINNKREGKGKYIYEDGEYYIGEYKNNIKNGKGKEYYANGNIRYEGDFINDNKEGSGKYIYENGKYYIGQWKNNVKHGKGKHYYANGSIEYEGDFINDKREGSGKYIYENGDYYIGQFKNDLSHGKGIEYYSNGKIMYEGDWVNDKREGHGKYIYEDNNIYVGQFKNNFSHGKGKEYYANGNIKFEGDWVIDRPEGYGKFIYEDGEYYIGEFKNGLIHMEKENYIILMEKFNMKAILLMIKEKVMENIFMKTVNII